MFDPVDVQQTENDADIDVDDQPKQKPKTKKQRQKFNPKYIAAARELRDRFLEQALDDPRLLGGVRDAYSGGKYQIGRDVAEAPSVNALPMGDDDEAMMIEGEVIDAEVIDAEDRKAA